MTLQVRNRPSALTCPYCRDRLGPARITCACCQTPYHRECIEALGRCATLGCETRLNGRSSLLGLVEHNCGECGYQTSGEPLRCPDCEKPYHAACVEGSFVCRAPGCDELMWAPFHPRVEDGPLEGFLSGLRGLVRAAGWVFALALACVVVGLVGMILVTPPGLLLMFLLGVPLWGFSAWRAAEERSRS